jgi:hypothetical protein
VTLKLLMCLILGIQALALLITLSFLVYVIISEIKEHFEKKEDIDHLDLVALTSFFLIREARKKIGEKRE